MILMVSWKTISTMMERIECGISTMYSESFHNTIIYSVSIMSDSLETEVFRFSQSDFDTNKAYAFALHTRKEGRWPNVRYYTTNPLQYVGKYVRSERWGMGEGSGGAEIFNDNGTENRIELDYEGKTCFLEVPLRVIKNDSHAYSQMSSTSPPKDSTDTEDYWHIKCKDIKQKISKNNEFLSKFTNANPDIKKTLEDENHALKNDIIKYRCEWPKTKRMQKFNSKDKLSSIHESISNEDNNDNLTGGKRRPKRRSAKINRIKRHTKTRKSKNRRTTRKK